MTISHSKTETAGVLRLFLSCPLRFFELVFTIRKQPGQNVALFFARFCSPFFYSFLASIFLLVPDFKTIIKKGFKAVINRCMKRDKTSGRISG